MSRTALIVDGAAGSHDTASETLRRLGFATPDRTTPATLFRPLDNNHYDLLILPLDILTPPRLAELEMRLRRDRRLLVIGTASAPDPALILNAMRAGMHEFVLSPPAPGELEAAIDRVFKRSGDTTTTGQIFAVYSAKGGLGATTIAVNVADALVRRASGGRVSIVDLDVSGSDLRVFLDLPTAYDTGDLLSKLDRLDGNLLESLFSATSTGVWALPGSDDPEVDGDFDGAAMASIIKRLRAQFACTVLDCEHHLSERTLGALDSADRVLLVTQLDVAALKSTQKTLALCRRLGYSDEKLALIVNRHQPEALLRRRDAEEVLGCEIFWTLPNDYTLTSTAVARGVPLSTIDPSADLVRAFDDLAAKLNGEEPGLTDTAERAIAAGSKIARFLGRRRKA